jgi:glucose-1-phosphate cytidylyltransferase
MGRKKMKVVILCGGFGTRLKEETEYRPKPMVEIGNRPVLWHIMKMYSNYGFNDFILCLGYKKNMIKEYFLNYEAMNNDCTVRLGERKSIDFHSKHEEKDWTVTLADTGDEPQTGSRVKRIEKYVNGEPFMLTYGDGVADLDISKLAKFHESHGKIGTVTGVHPSSRFGDLVIKNNQVVHFHEKAQVNKGLISGGFFVFKNEFFDYLSNGDNCVLEKEPLENLTAVGQLMVHQHEGFWQCVDTYRELEFLNSMWKTGNPPWKTWK